MIIGKIRKWGNSLAFLIPKEEAKKLNLKENEEVVADIVSKENPLKELFGAFKNKITKEEFLRDRKELESKWT